MRRFALTEFGKPLVALEVRDPVPGGTEVVLDLRRCGLCHSDLHLHEGHYDLGGGKRLNLADRGVELPHTLGHEIMGRLSSTGPDAPIDEGQIGRSFLVYPWIGCGACRRCREGQENLCATSRFLGVHRPGGFAEKVVVPHPRYLIDVEGLDPSGAATLACSGLTSFAALKKVKADPGRDWLLLIGAGGLGQSAFLLARALGYRRIAVVDAAEPKREAARIMGADLVLDPGAADTLQRLQGLDSGLDTAIDFVGTAETARLAVDALRRGGTYIVVGLFGGEITLSLPLLPIKALTLTGSYVGNLAELRELVDLVRTRGLETVATETMPLPEVNRAVQRLRNGDVAGRVVLTTE